MSKKDSKKADPQPINEEQTEQQWFIERFCSDPDQKQRFPFMKDRQAAARSAWAESQGDEPAPQAMTLSDAKGEGG